MAAPKKPKSPAVRAGKDENHRNREKGQSSRDRSGRGNSARDMVSPTINGNGIATDAPTAEMIRARAYEIFLGRMAAMAMKFLIGWPLSANSWRSFSIRLVTICRA